MAETGTAAETRARHAPDHASRSEVSYEAALKAADALFSRPAKADPHVSGPARRTPSKSSDVSVAGAGGRILRAIDEPSPPDPTDLRAEQAPKRRGRKPGSKNKPKIAGIPVTAAPPSFVQAAPKSGRAADDRPAEAEGAPVPRQNPTVPYRQRRKERFTWIRTKLRPGEAWKRRIPKVCW